jgi:hypothetical protein
LPSSSNEDSELAWPGDLRTQHRLVSIERREHHATPVLEDVFFARECTVRQRAGAPWNFRDVVGAHSRSKWQRLRSDDNRASALARHRRHVRVGLQPLARHEGGDAAHHDCEKEHDDVVRAHGRDLPSRPFAPAPRTNEASKESRSSPAVLTMT